MGSKNRSWLIISIFLVIGLAISNLVTWNFRYSSGYHLGTSEGYTIGYSEGSDTAYKQGEEYGFDIGFEEGNYSGFNSGHQIGYDLGYMNGNEKGYSHGFNEGNGTGHQIGYDRGFQSGFKSGNNSGYEAGFYHGFMEGVKEGVGSGFYLRDPTYGEAIKFIKEDKTDRIEYNQTFVCTDYSAMFKTNAFNAGFRCFYVTIDFENYGHAIVAFNTTDQGMIYIEPQHDDIVTVKIGMSYSALNNYRGSPDDIIIDFDLFP